MKGIYIYKKRKILWFFQLYSCSKLKRITLFVQESRKDGLQFFEEGLVSMVLQALQSFKEARDRGHSFDDCISHPSDFLPQAEHFKETLQGYLESSHLLPQLNHIREGLQKVTSFHQAVYIVGIAQVADIPEAIKNFISDTHFVTF